MSRHTLIWPLAVAAAVSLVTLPAQALYKVVGPDGRVTFTDRPPGQDGTRVTPVPGMQPVPPKETGRANLPAELRAAVARFPVTLYTSPGCRPCDTGRNLLQQRGVPFTEYQIVSEEDAQALVRVLGGRTLPGLTIGKQVLVGLSSVDWSSYLDAAGYPAESRLPAEWPRPPATPLAPRAASAPGTEVTRPDTPLVPDPPTNPAGIRF